MLISSCQALSGMVSGTALQQALRDRHGKNRISMGALLSVYGTYGGQQWNTRGKNEVLQQLTLPALGLNNDTILGGKGGCCVSPSALCQKWNIPFSSFQHWIAQQS